MHYTRAILTFTMGIGFVAQVQQTPETRLPVNVAAGRETFREYCAVCHGVDAMGNGPAVGSLRTAPTNLTTLSKRNAGKFPADRVRDAIYSSKDEVSRVWRRAIPAHGSPDMPMWGDVFHNLRSSQKLIEARVSNLIAYLESLQEP